MLATEPRSDPGVVRSLVPAGLDHHHRSGTDMHHPQVRRTSTGTWVWVCGCGAASCRTTSWRVTWHQAYVGALYHAGTLAA